MPGFYLQNLLKSGLVLLHKRLSLTTWHPLGKRERTPWKRQPTSNGSDNDQFVENLPYIVAIFCGFGLLVIAVIKIFDQPVQMEWVASGQVIQFASVMVLLIIVASLGILHILEKEGIGTLLGAIAGYVLSQGVGRAAARAATENSLCPRAKTGPKARTRRGQRRAIRRRRALSWMTDFLDTPSLRRKGAPTMPKSYRPYTPEFRQRIIGTRAQATDAGGSGPSV